MRRICIAAVSVALLAGCETSSTPQPSAEDVVAVEVLPVEDLHPKHPSPSPSPKASKPKADEKPARADKEPKPVPAAPEPAPSQEKPGEPAPRPNPAPTPEPEPSPSTKISSYMECGYYPKTAQPCIDKGLTLYHGNVLAGHDYMGYAWMDDLPVGRVVHVASGTMAGTYKVFGHHRVGRQGGSFPPIQADLIMQTCSGSGTGFSLLRRI